MTSPRPRCSRQPRERARRAWLHALRPPYSVWSPPPARRRRRVASSSRRAAYSPSTDLCSELLFACSRAGRPSLFVLLSAPFTETDTRTHAHAHMHVHVQVDVDMDGYSCRSGRQLWGKAVAGALQSVRSRPFCTRLRRVRVTPVVLSRWALRECRLPWLGCIHAACTFDFLVLMHHRRSSFPFHVHAHDNTATENSARVMRQACNCTLRKADVLADRSHVSEDGEELKYQFILH